MGRRLLTRRKLKKSKTLIRIVRRKKDYYLPCKVCKFKVKVGGPDVLGVVCGDCLSMDPLGVARVRAGRSVAKLTIAKRLLETEDTQVRRKEKRQEAKEKRKKERKKARIERKKKKSTFTFVIQRYWDKKQRKIQRKEDRDLERKDRKKNKKKRSKKKYHSWKVEYDDRRRKISFDKKKSERQVIKYYKEKGKKLSFIRRVKED